MPYPFPPDLQELVLKQMASGRYTSEDELLRSALRALEEDEQDLEAVRESLADWHAGDPGVPLADAFASVRAKHRGGESR